MFIALTPRWRVPADPGRHNAYWKVADHKRLININLVHFGPHEDGGTIAITENGTEQFAERYVDVCEALHAHIMTHNSPLIVHDTE